ncbi:Ankyrin repeat protein [Legionella busanensis]|uniref:Ankyrin repeat protein n=1 Tax=Legionella busanensis TaxID=190655 RepID=A0A378JQQ2_9GAMM|nr:ankyrin repeat domain-containing protein [Legionella busanensis]STX50452.1 Ankyrin repeat protein [Legionella busanensis]
MLETPLLEVIQSNIFAKYHLPLIKQKTPDKNKYWDFLTPQQSYGVLSACRRAALINILFNILEETQPDAANLITPEDLFYLQIVALFAHSIWENKLNDEGILAIKVNCQNFLKSIGVTHALAHQFAQLLDPTEVTSQNTKQNWLKIILNSADSLNNMRKANLMYSIHKIPLVVELKKIDKQNLIEELAKEVLDMLVLQHDIGVNGVQVMDEKYDLIYERRGIHPKSKVKLHYEYSNNCYGDVIKDIKKFPMLSQYYKNDTLPLRKVNLLEDIRVKQRDEIRHSAPTIRINNDFLFKSLRGDNANYFLQFIDGVISPFIHHPLRFKSKKIYTVDGKGVHLRSEKTPIYSKEQKKLYSKKQSTTYGMPDLQPNPFNFSEEKVKTVGVIFFDIMKNALLADHLLTRDVGSSVRPNDFNFLPEAEQYFKQRVNKVLFAKDNIEAFKNALRNEKKYKYHNEVFAHLRFTADDSCQVFINVDTLEARLLAQLYARMIYARLRNVNECLPDYDVKICYYMPTSSLHLKQYTQQEQLLDIAEAEEILQNDEYLLEKIIENNFELLFFLPAEFLIKYLNKNIGGHTLIIQILSQGYLHILDFFIELKLLDAPILEKLIVMHVQELHDTKTLIQIAYFAIKKDRPFIFQQVLETLSKQPDYENYINEAVNVSGAKVNLLQLAFSIQKENYIHALLNLKSININQVDSDGNTILHDAVLTGDEYYVRLALDLGVDSNAANSKGFTGLHYAVAFGHCNIVRLLLSQSTFTQFNAEVEVSNGIYNQKLSLLELAAVQDQVEVLKILHQDGRFDFSKEYGFKRTLLSVAEDNPLTLAYLLTLPEIDFKKKDVKNYSGGKNALHKAAANGFVDVVKMLLEKGMPINDTSCDRKETALHFAIGPEKNDDVSIEDRIEIIRLLFTAGIDKNAVNSSGESALGLAVTKDCAPLIKYLVENGCKVKGIKISLLEAALERHNHAIPKLIKYEIQAKAKLFGRFFKHEHKEKQEITTAPSESLDSKTTLNN